MNQFPRLSPWVALLLLSITHCDRPTPPTPTQESHTQETHAQAVKSAQAATSAQAVTSALASASSAASSAVIGSAPSPSASAIPPAPVDPASATQWSGTYESTRAVVETPPKVPDFTWKNDDGSAAVGEGKISLAVSEGTITGEATGPLGPQQLTGIIEDSTLRFELLPVDPTTPKSMTGSGLGEMKNGVFSGTLRVCGPKGVEVRTISFSLTPS